MNINFSKKEYKALMDLLQVSDWVLHAHQSVDRDGTENYRALMQKISQHADEMGMDKLITKDEVSGEYFATKKYEDQGPFIDFIDDFEEQSFWSNLTFKLAIRDLIEQDGERKVEEMEFSDRGSKIIQLEDWYNEEFNNSGIQNVRVKTSPTKKPN